MKNNNSHIERLIKIFKLTKFINTMKQTFI